MTNNFQTIVGLCGSGLTTQCISWTQELLEQGIQPDRILVLVRHAGKKKEFTARLLEKVPNLVGSLHVSGFITFIEKQLSNFWVDVCKQLPNLPPTFQPQFLTKDLTQFLLSEAIETCPDHFNNFRNCNLAPYKILDQIISDSYIAHSSGVPTAAIGDRLAQAWPDQTDINSKLTLKAIPCCIKKLRELALSHQVIDFGYQMEIFNNVLLKTDRFWQSWDHLIVDQSEESPEVLLNFYQQALDRKKDSFIGFTYTIGGGSSYTNAGDRVSRFLSQNTTCKFIDRFPNMGKLGLQIARNLGELPRMKGIKLPQSQDYTDRVHSLVATTYLEALELTISEVKTLLKQGVTPEEITILMPVFDQVVMQILLHSEIGKYCSFINPYGSFLRYPIVRGMLTIAQLTNPQWNLIPNREQVAGMLSLFLGIDRVRASLLAQTLDQNTLKFTHLIPEPERIQFSTYDKFKLLTDGLEFYQRNPVSLEIFWGTMLQEFSHEMKLTKTDREVLKHLLAAVNRFFNKLPKLSDFKFLMMLLSGQTPTILQRPDHSNKIIVATALQFLSTERITNYQFWFNITAPEWRKQIWHPLLNHEVLNQEWEGGIFGLDQDQKSRTNQLVRTLLNLTCRNQEQIYLVNSFTSIQGQDNQSNLDITIKSAAKTN